MAPVNVLKQYATFTGPDGCLSAYSLLSCGHEACAHLGDYYREDPVPCQACVAGAELSKESSPKPAGALEEGRLVRILRGSFAGRTGTVAEVHGQSPDGHGPGAYVVHVHKESTDDIVCAVWYEPSFLEAESDTPPTVARHYHYTLIWRQGPGYAAQPAADAWSDKAHLIGLLQGMWSDTPIYQLGRDELPEGAEDIRPLLDSPPDEVYVAVVEGVLKYFGITYSHGTFADKETA